MALNDFKESTINFLIQCKRVLRISKKPDRFEYSNVAKITGIGIVIIGFIGFIITIITMFVGK
jgi:protein transport protein SEC61 subunit gamma and related proteins